jgi:hypothetical protein
VIFSSDQILFCLLLAAAIVAAAVYRSCTFF